MSMDLNRVSNDPKRPRTTLYCAECKKTMQFVMIAGHWRCDKDTTNNTDGCGRRLRDMNYGLSS